MSQSGLTPPLHIQFDGHIHRFSTGNKRDKTGWYIAFGDGVPAGTFGDWRSGFESTWRADIGRSLTPVEESTNARRMAEARQIRDAEMARTHEVSLSVVQKIWSEATLASDEHPYLQRKGIKGHGARVTGDGRLIVPLRDIDGSLASLQYIDADGGKLYHPGAAVSGKFLIVGASDDPGTIYLAEGFATAATIYEVTDRPCVAAYSASNLVPVLGELRGHYGNLQDIVIVADNDASGVGQKYAEQASAKHGARVVVPPEPGDANDYRQAGGDLGTLLVPKIDEWIEQADDFSEQPAPVAWLVKHWLQEQALIMVHGPSGGGKTFVVLDWCLRMAAGVPEWFGSRVKDGSVLYLAGEGHHGLKGRVAAWKIRYGTGRRLTMWLSKSGCDLNTAEGYHKVIESIRRLLSVPNLIVVDTLHRFLMGDENSAQDAKGMLDACAGLMSEFGCSVLLVHHTGVNEEAQHRARGSSAWRGALDIEISIVPAKDGAPMQIVQRKSKDAEMAQPIFAELESVEIPGWIDEDGEQVTSAVMVPADAPTKVVGETKLSKNQKLFEKAWWESGAELLNGMPYVTRSAMREKLSEGGKRSERTIENEMTQSYADKLIGMLTNGGFIVKVEHGWVVSDNGWASVLLISRGFPPE
jgi:phage/plasmid primase-like uncharacterized protein